MQDVLEAKNSAIKDLQYELARVCKVCVYGAAVQSHQWHMCVLQHDY